MSNSTVSIEIQINERLYWQMRKLAQQQGIDFDSLGETAIAWYLSQVVQEAA